MADPADGEARRAFWRFVDAHGDHEWVAALKRGAAANHPHGLDAGNKKLFAAIDDAHGKPHAGGPDWLTGVFRAFERS